MGAPVVDGICCVTQGFGARGAALRLGSLLPRVSKAIYWFMGRKTLRSMLYE